MALLLVVTGFVLMFEAGEWKDTMKVIQGDVIGYYNYLPGLLQHHDPDFAGCGYLRAGYTISPEGVTTQKMSMGLAFLYLPFYLLGWLYIIIRGFPNFEYGETYSLMLNISAIVYFLIGILFLRKLLLRYFNDIAVAITLLVVFAGTNLLFYTSYFGPMSHAYNFSMIAIFLWLVIRWHENPSRGISVLLGITTGLIVLIRPSNVTILLIPLLWGLHDRESRRHKMTLLKSSLPKLVIIGVCALLVWIPQMIYWYHSTGHLLFFSYQGEGFFFENPRIILGWFSYRNGWLVYAPVMIFALAGFFFLKGKWKVFLLPLTVYLLASAYIIYSWWCWWYVGFGSRAMIDLYAVLAIPLCAIVSRILTSRLWLRIPALIVLTVLLALGPFKTHQYRMGVIHFDSMSKKAYWNSFFKTKITSGDYYLLLKEPDYDAAREGDDKVRKGLLR